MGKISNINREKQLIGLFLLSREAIEIAIENKFIANECVNKFNINVLDCIFNQAKRDSEFIPTIDYILDNIDLSEKEKKESRVKLARYKKMIQREIVNDRQYTDMAERNILALRDLSIKRKAIHVINNGLERIDLNARDFISSINRELAEIDINDGLVTEISIHTGFIELKEELKYIAENDIEFGVKSYLRDIDKMLQDAIAKETLTYVVGRPSNYKTGFALNWATNMAQNGIPVAFFSHEMAPKNVYRRILARITGITMNQLKRPKELTAEQWQELDVAIEKVREWPLFVVDGAKLHIGEIDSVVAYLKSKYGIQAVFEDYFQLIRKFDGTIPTEERDFAEVSEELRMIPKKYDLAMIALSQANRSCEARDDKRPTLKDIRNTGKAEQDAENILYVYRDEFYFHSQSEVPNHLEVGALKVREGELKRALLHFDGARATLNNCDPLIVMDKSSDYIGGGMMG